MAAEKKLADSTSHSLTNTAYFYAETYWRAQEADWIKTLLLFFDEIAILLPNYMYGRHREADPSLAGPLEDNGLLRILEPGRFISQGMAEDLAEALVALLADGAFDNLNTEGPIHYAELSYTRMGWGVDMELSAWLIGELEDKGLARPSQDGVSVPLHPTIRKLILFLLSQLARKSGGGEHTTFHPVTANGAAVGDIVSTLSLETLPSAGHLIALDIEPVSIDLSSVPLEDVLQFREEHGSEFRAYTRDARKFVRELGRVDDPKQRREQIVDRQIELADRAVQLRKSTARRWLKPAGKIGLGLVGAAWNLASGDPVGALLSAGQAAFEVPDSADVDAYSYIVRAEGSLSRHV